MLSNTLLKDFSKERLRGLLALFFAALAVPTAILIWQAQSQLKWEAFHQYRGIAEELTTRIDSSLIATINAADARSFADYTFLVVTGDPSANFVQRSPLSNYPVIAEIPGVIGYFQVDADGAFSTPLLPAQGKAAQELGISADEYRDRLALAEQLQAVLADNRLVQSRSDVGLRRGLVATSDAPEVAPEEPAPASVAANVRASRARQIAADSVPSLQTELESDDVESADDAIVGEFGNESFGYKDAVDEPSGEPFATERNYSQQVFDELNLIRDGVSSNATPSAEMDRDDSDGEAALLDQRLNTIGKVSDLKLDDAYQKKSEDLERKEQDFFRDNRGDSPTRTKRREQISLPESAPASAEESIGGTVGHSAFRIKTFESEVDPLEFSVLDSGHFVLFRKVWHDGQRYIQGLLINQQAFVDEAIDAQFTETALSSMSNLIVAYHDDVIRSVSQRQANRSYPNVTEAFDGALLYRNRLSAPLNSLELIFSIEHLPPGPGASVLRWITLVLAVVFVGGFLLLYRLGLSQINLARQQQDFVSAVSHELKTPLTSIRMYGEMLKEGWADEEKRQSYYEFIHGESERLTRLISNVLQLAKITRNEPQFDLQPVKVGELMSNIESKISNQVAHAGFELTFRRDKETENTTIVIDEDCFAQIVINLVDNAIKFSSGAECKRIEIESQFAGNNKVEFKVRDFGPGIPKEQMKKIFELFYRSESELTRETVGTGIGLAIVHQLSTAMNGKIDVINKDPGAEFRVTFRSKTPSDDNKRTTGEEKNA